MRRQNPHPMSFLHKRYHRFRNYPEKEKKCLMKYEKLFQPGKIGNLDGISVKTAYSNVQSDE